MGGVKTGSRYSKRRKRFAVVTRERRWMQSSTWSSAIWNIKCWEELTGKRSENSSELQAWWMFSSGSFITLPAVDKQTQPNNLGPFGPLQRNANHNIITRSFITALPDLHHNKYAVGTVYLTNQTWPAQVCGPLNPEFTQSWSKTGIKHTTVHFVPKSQSD